MLYECRNFIISIEYLLVNYCLQHLERKEGTDVEELDTIRERLKKHFCLADLSAASEGGHYRQDGSKFRVCRNPNWRKG